MPASHGHFRGPHESQLHPWISLLPSEVIAGIVELALGYEGQERPDCVPVLELVFAGLVPAEKRPPNRLADVLALKLAANPAIGLGTQLLQQFRQLYLVAVEQCIRGGLITALNPREQMFDFVAGRV